MPSANSHSVSRSIAAHRRPSESTEAAVSHTLRLVRDKLFYEFASFILGSGNALILWIFWPCWILFGLAVWIVWQLLV